MKEFDDKGEPFTSIDREFVYDTNCNKGNILSASKSENINLEPKEEKSEEEYKNQLLNEVGIVSEEDKDDLKRIKGIGKVYEGRLNSIGVFSFAQMAKLKDGGIEAIEAITGFPGRVKRENWVGQAKTLGEGGTTGFSSRVDKGDVDYKKSEDERYNKN